MSRNDVIIGIVAAVLVVFSLVVALVVPNRNPSFPGRHLRLFVLVAVLLVGGMLTAVEVLGETHHFAKEGAETGAAPTGTAPTGGGNAAAGKQIFTSTANPACATCHTLQEAGATGTVGPNLDDVLKGKDAAFIRQSIIEPNAEIAKGFQAGVMPQNFGQQLNDQQLADLLAFLVQAIGGPKGNAAAGKQIFTATAQPPCATCHTLQEAGATGTVGPDLDQVLTGKDAAFIHESIVNPNAEIASGFQAGIMPQNYAQQLDDTQLADLVAFLVQATSG